MNPVLQTIRNRRSIRKFTNKRVNDAHLRSILEAGRWAPSGLNNQPWRFVTIADASMRQAVSEQTKYQKVMKAAPLHIAVFLDAEQSYNRTKDVQGIGACLQNMLLTVHSLGLGAVWMGEILNRREEVEKILGVPKSYELMAVLAVGHPVRSSQDSDRKSLSELVFKTF
ncbi:MAG: nitroreductase family protein [bacterium]|nr:nitroreductase family protein [bacterium]